MAAWKIAAAVAGLGAVAAALVWLVVAPARTDGGGGLAVIGDAAPQIHAALGTEQALPLHTAALTVVSVAGWERLRYMGDMQALCGDACADETALVRAVRLTPGGARKVVFVNLSRWPGIERVGPPAGDGADWAGADFGCLATALAAERARLRPGALPPCANTLAEPGRLRLGLPWGLGTV